MKFSEFWLREWVKLAINSEELTHQITMAGLEVNDVAPVAGKFTGVVVGEVVECGLHPDADKLCITKVNVGGKELLEIICGASNCRLGIKVAVATIGAVLPGNFKIKVAKLRGQSSYGMLCSFTELGINVESDGIMELPAEAILGTNFREFLSLNDVTINVDVTANRADCLSIKGMAREVGILNRADVSVPAFKNVKPLINDKISVAIEAPIACPRYLNRIVKNVNAKATSPLWMQEKLRRSSIRSINPIVDITNYVMLEQGQPMHAFDLMKIEGGIVVRMAKQGEQMTLLNSNEVELNDNTLIITDHNKVLAIAGIFGDESSGVTDETTDVLLEAAFFAPDAIRGRARSYGLHTDSSHRFERGVDSNLQYHAMERATQLLIEICGGETGEIVSKESAEHLPKAKTISLRRIKLNRLLGHCISSDDVVEILTRLGCDVETTESGWVAKTPSWRFDLTIEEDLVEEVGRIFGYNNIPNQVPKACLTMKNCKEMNQPLKRVRDLLVDRGYHEAITYSFVEPKQQALIVCDVKPLILQHPISAEMSSMRLSLWPGLLNVVAYNQKRQQSRIRLFEAGLRFIPEVTAENGMRQEMMLAGVITGTSSEEHWNIESNTVDFFDLKGDLEAILELTANEIAYSFKASKHNALQPDQSAAIEVGGKIIGHIGTVHPKLEPLFGLNGRTIVFEIEWAAINQRIIPEAIMISKFPANRRDIAVIVADNVESVAVVRACLGTSNALIQSSQLFDLYTGKGVEYGKKSLTITLTLQSAERTLEENDISESVAEVIKHLGNKFNAHLRD
ncbi:phenylalanine--tRNA ligase subunit beta [Candidatus Enterovibrio altilux]|uniref:Phenylalanine--tRNA ligase beta subunit n=1 Tax=Candidatus Enterovibrio altilux TaxID=1927128 RepID=A0A291B704_9GAMM|nr:phenylalanine--tRNA ligase subunit beta [Candidatus Enterovibrio luxaltus]ATF08778.1 Phenylalanyl-tRNA synthetase beta chain [Candidatus Enterovibrio luxaltus]